MDKLTIIILLVLSLSLIASILVLWFFWVTLNERCKWDKPSTYCNEMDDICPEELMNFCELYKGEICK